MIAALPKPYPPELPQIHSPAHFSILYPERGSAYLMGLELASFRHPPQQAWHILVALLPMLAAALNRLLCLQRLKAFSYAAVAPGS